jgi:hypothetical protein
MDFRLLLCLPSEVPAHCHATQKSVKQTLGGAAVQANVESA